ncbi:ATP-binding protein [Pseudomonas capsici]|uniref:ATP-binding protein n=1 Tax=Pseudomonas capsici TaxID=2810614 RepID=UPI0021F16356|nr:ATP-binding protein [Pseudomonas capsici]MCV4282025.1 ATP-binding protein [Pseudomonas capsici]
MNSIRHRTLTLIIALLMVGLVVMTLFNVHDSNHEIAEIYDAQLAQNARLLEGVMHMPLQQEELEHLYQAFNKALAQAEKRGDGHPYEGKIAFQVWDKDGNALVHTASAPPFDKPAEKAGFSDFQDSNRHQWRAFVLLDTDSGLRIWVGERDDVRSDLVNRIIRHTVLPNLIGSLLLIAAIWLAIRWGLKPLANFASTLRGRHPGSLQPLSVALPSELEPMQAALNRLLGQIQDLLRRERRFIADAAHEMRTPLAVLRVHAQNVLEAHDEKQRQESLGYLIIGVDRTTRLVNQLLTIARLEPGASSHSQPPVDLVGAVRDSLVQLTPWVLNKGLELSFECTEETHMANVDFATLNIALHNLITNAVNFSPDKGLITVSLAFPDNHFLLSIEDQGPGIDETERDRLFEPFYSKDNAQGVGLGLAIVQKIMLLTGGETRLDNRSEGGLRASLKIPLA